jgi:hypothetical protein
VITQQYLESLRVIDNAHVRFWYQVEFDPIDAMEAARFLGGHRASRLPEMVEAINATLPVCDFGMLNGKPNQNNGTQHHRIALGRENSRVLYVRFIKTYHDKLTAADMERIKTQLQYIGIRFGCGESDPIEESSTILEWRYWWG